ncbi:hypothetical protein PUN28_011525 [Cardiocondyla obscurior]|uniref:CRAL-TRIO domain-containing protein n=1 Tax=Cardiocondyla obscurior TaxID=286306 RepID=A0AAW2FED2_9HYME
MENVYTRSDREQDHVWKKLSDEDKRYAEEWLNETDEGKRNGFKMIRRWLDQNNSLDARIDDFLILRFLRVCKFDVKKTKNRMRSRYKQRSKLPQWFLNKDPFLPELQELINLGIYLPLLKPDNQGRLVIIIRPAVYDPRTTDVANVVKLYLILLETAVKYYPAASIYGYVMIVDLTGITIRHLVQYRPSLLMNAVQMWQNYPIRILSINIFNVPAIFEATAMILRSFMSEKLRNRFHMSSSMKPDDFKDIPTDTLPVEYGGTGGTIQELTKFWKKTAEKNRDVILEEEK